MTSQLSEPPPAGISARDVEDIRKVFLRQCAAETAHDLQALDDIMFRAGPGQPDPVSFVARAYTFWGREAVMDHFRKTFEGIWVMEPDEATLRVLPVGPDAAHVYAACRITLGALDQPASAVFLINEIAVRTPDGWKISTVIPVPTR
jgi:hypothetical protein